MVPEYLASRGAGLGANPQRDSSDPDYWVVHRDRDYWPGSPRAETIGQDYR